MTDEENEAIEYIEQFIGIEKQYKYKPIKIKTLTNTRPAIQTILNLIKKQQAEIENYKQLYEKALNDLVISDHYRLHKDKIIYEIAKAFKQDDSRSVDKIIEYFTNKVEGGK